MFKGDKPLVCEVIQTYDGYVIQKQGTRERRATDYKSPRGIKCWSAKEGGGLWFDVYTNIKDAIAAAEKLEKRDRVEREQAARDHKKAQERAAFVERKVWR